MPHIRNDNRQSYFGNDQARRCLLATRGIDIDALLTGDISAMISISDLHIMPHFGVHFMLMRICGEYFGGDRGDCLISIVYLGVSFRYYQME